MFEYERMQSERKVYVCVCVRESNNFCWQRLPSVLKCFINLFFLFQLLSDLNQCSEQKKKNQKNLIETRTNLIKVLGSYLLA